MIKKQITAFERNKLREEKYYVQTTLSGLQYQIDNITISGGGGPADDINVDGTGGTPIGGEYFYYADPTTNKLFVQGNPKEIELGTSQYISHPSSPDPNTYVINKFGLIGDGCVVTASISGQQVTEAKLASDVTNRMFTASGYRSSAELIIYNDVNSPRLKPNTVNEAAIQNGVVSRAKESFIDGSLLGNLLPERWSWRHEDPYVYNYSGGSSQWLALNSPSYSGWFNNHPGYAFILNTTPTLSGQTRIYFGTSNTDYNITLYPASYFDTTLYPDEEFTYLNVVATSRANATVTLNKPIFGIKLANGTHITFSGYSYQFGTTVRSIADYCVTNSWITAPTSGILYLEQNIKPTLSRNFVLTDLQVFYSSKTPNEYYDDGANCYTPNQYRSVDASYIHPSVSLVPIGCILDFAGATPPAGWLIASGQSLAVASYSGLYNVLGYSWGGSGANFSLPDLRSRVTAGVSSTHTFATYSGVENSTTYELEYEVGLSTKVLLDGELGYAGLNLQPTAYLYKIIFAGN